MNEKRAYIAGSILVAAATLFGLMAGAAYMQIKINEPIERASSFTHYSDSTWQVNDTVYWRHGADTIKLDVTKLR